MKYVLIVLLLIACNKTETKSISVVKNKNIFTSTQEYEIMSWVIKKSENYKANIYRCQANKKTIGWGFTHVKSVRNIHHADRIFKNIVNPLFTEVDKEYPTLTYLQKAAIVSLLYNTGDLDGIKKSNFAKALVRKDINKAVANFKDWNKVKIRKGKYIISRGLVNRRSYESKLLDNSFTMNDYLKLRQEISNIYKQNRT